ncbi:MAG TPA: TetR/AcrR family transcriptional regulator [Thermoanaerobaculia bacterium]|nr:TetR/AcrR family transcriptional regulator [Thermoanaerobaculia bacterium]
MADTRELLLDTAERLFAARGIDAVSLRDITAEAEANIAAVNYHFGSKENLIREVISRRLQPLNEERLRLLDAFAAASPSGTPSLPQVLYALVHPVMEMMTNDPEKGTPFVRLMTSIHAGANGCLSAAVLTDMRGTVERFIAALSAAFPGVELREILWRAHFAIGAMAHTASAGAMLETLSGGVCRFTSAEDLSTRLVAFLTGGFLADPAKLKIHPARRKAKGVRK